MAVQIALCYRTGHKRSKKLSDSEMISVKDAAKRQLNNPNYPCDSTAGSEMHQGLRSMKADRNQQRRLNKSHSDRQRHSPKI